MANGKTEKFTKDRLISMWIDSNSKMIQYMAHLDDTMKALNDNNQLHTTILTQNTNAINAMVKNNTTFLRLFNIILLLVIAALVILAGAEKALKFVPLL